MRANLDATKNATQQVKIFYNPVPCESCESSGSSSSSAVAALGGVLGVVVVTAVAVLVMVIVFFTRKLNRAQQYTTTPLKRYAST